MKRVGIAQKVIFVVATSLLLLTCCPSFFQIQTITLADTPPTLYVGEDEEYSSIQAAIDNATDGYRIVVYNGTYYENLTIDKKIDLFGEDRNTTIIDGNNANTVITISVANVNISHFTIMDGGLSNGNSIIQINAANTIITDNKLMGGYHGIYLNSVGRHLIYDNIITQNTGNGLHLIQSNNNINISYNTITSNYNGIYFYRSDANKIYYNTIQSNDVNGIFFNNSCDNNYIIANNISNNGRTGIYLNDYSNYSIINHNSVYLNQKSGIVLENSSWNLNIYRNTVSRNTNYGFMIVGSTNTLQQNMISHNSKDGIYLTADDNITVTDNTIHHNTMAGIRLYNSTDDFIYSNEIYSNSGYGMYLDFFTLGNLIYDNYFHDNSHNAIDKSLTRNRWNRTKISGTNIVGGDYICGNYWDDYDEASEGAVDNDDDGIADSAYTVYHDNKDYGPLLDTTPPTVGIPIVSPEAQTLGSYTDITVTVTDNIEVRSVYLILIDPNGNTTNISITQNRTGTTYTCSKQFSPIGPFSCYISAADTRNWASSTSVSFYINEGIPPTVTDNSPSTAAPSSYYTFNATVADDVDNASQIEVYVIWSHDNKSGNNSMTNAGADFFEKTILLDSSINSLRYYFYASDQWGNSVTTEQTSVNVIDTKPPQINIRRYGESFDTLPNSFTFIAKITDDCQVDTVYIDYWYEGSINRTVEMDVDTNLGEDYYKKVIIPKETVDRVYCIIYANDTSNNQNNTKPPVPILTVPESGFVLQDISFSAADSFDLDGSITNYSWDFGDGIRATGQNVTHQYHSSGIYTVKLVVQDNDRNDAANTSSINITAITPYVISWQWIRAINQTYNLTLTEQFYCYDSDYDGVYDIFIDPNQQLTLVVEEPVTLDNHDCFLISTNTDVIPEFFWDTYTGEIVSISHTEGIVSNEKIDEQKEQAIITYIVEKGIWIYFEIQDSYPNSPVSISTNNRKISSDLIWRKNNKIYVLDDAEVEYLATFTDIFPEVQDPTFQPSDGGVIGENQPSITIAYNIPVKITYATFGNLDITNDLETEDNNIYIYTPPAYLSNGTYPLVIDAQAMHGNSFKSSSASYIFFKYGHPPKQSFLEANWQFLLIGGTIAAFAAMFLYFRITNVTLDDFIFIRNSKILPFFKTIIVGPISVNVDNKKISKAEFYIDGTLKETVTDFPFLWKWQEPAFLKHTLEAKVYDDEGNSVSSGEKSFYIFNPFGEKSVMK